ncbi:Bgt-51329 [Blumeria graminis f. sp. tritici]|uniref:Bgt-51329 n=1 Tax=Blumeria graminis f. sp. tritici TaxID=62690 RepID=A0A9X9PSC9_BLUGR|nr:Bgt-51329 [Blumeria graminis f. sp. tritici]
MQCAIAFLLLAAEDPKNMDRLIVTQFGANKPSYGVYELQTSRNFPDPMLINQPDITWNPAMKNGTHIMSYCSISLQSHEIADKITSGLTNITPRAHFHWNKNTEAEMDCWKSLKFVDNPEEKIDENIMSNFSLEMKRKCTNQVILNLAFRGIIAVDGVYRRYGPPKAEQPVVVNLDQPMKLRSLLLNGELIKGKKTVFGQEALAWYQGHLHLFKRNRERNAWLPVTTIGYEINNGWLIANFININFPQITNNWKNYYQKCAIYKDILRTLSRSEKRMRHHEHSYRRHMLHGSQYDPYSRYNDLMDVCHSKSDRIFYRIYKDTNNFDNYFIDYPDSNYDNHYHDHKYLDQTARKYKYTIYAEFKKLIPVKLPTSPASGITMAM